jgi:hypothetical protein
MRRLRGDCVLTLKTSLKQLCRVRESCAGTARALGTVNARLLALLCGLVSSAR